MTVLAAAAAERVKAKTMARDCKIFFMVFSWLRWDWFYPTPPYLLDELARASHTGLVTRHAGVGVGRRPAQREGSSTAAAAALSTHAHRNSFLVQLDVGSTTAVFAGVGLDLGSDSAVEGGRNGTSKGLERGAQKVFLYSHIHKHLQRIALVVVLDLTDTVSHQSDCSEGLEAHATRVVTRVDVDHLDPLVPLDSATGIGIAGVDRATREVLEPLLFFDGFRFVRDGLAIFGTLSLALGNIVLVGHGLRYEARTCGTASQNGDGQHECGALEESDFHGFLLEKVGMGWKNSLAVVVLQRRQHPARWRNEET